MPKASAKSGSSEKGEKKKNEVAPCIPSSSQRRKFERETVAEKHRDWKSRQTLGGKKASPLKGRQGRGGIKKKTRRGKHNA